MAKNLSKFLYIPMQGNTYGGYMNRKEAMAAGLNKYDGKPCKNCGTTEKYVKSWSCVYCSQNLHKPSAEVQKRYAQSDKGKAVRQKINASDAQKERAKKYSDDTGYSKQYYQDNKDWWREQSYQKLYGIGVDEYNRMLTEQNHCCKVCGVHEKDLNKALAVDHCHTHGHVRSLLCTNCNTALGLLKEDVNIMKKLIGYVETVC